MISTISKETATTFVVSLVLFSLLSLYIGGLPIVASITSSLFLLTALYVASYLGHIKYLVVAPVLLLVSAEVTYRLYFGERVSIGVLESMMDTNTNEVSGLAASMPLFILLAIVIFLALLYVYRKIDKNRSKKITVALLLLFVINTAAVAFTLRKYDQLISDIKAYPSMIGLLYYSQNNLALGDLLVMVTDYQTRSLYAPNLSKTMPAAIVDKKPGKDLVVLVLGESSLPKRYGVYGYHKDTTPNLSRLMNDSLSSESACVVEHAHSVSPITRDSIAMTLSFATPEDMAPFYSEKSIINLANEHEYRTYWITSQLLKGPYDAKYGFLATDSENIIRTDWEDNHLAVELGNVLKEHASAEDKLFIVLHMAGSHLPYDDKFDPVDVKALPTAGNYDRSIHKTDRALGSIIDVLNGSGHEYSLLYTADHGEIVGRGHGLVRGGPDQFYVPLIAMSNDRSSTLCEDIEKTRNTDGFISGLSNKFVLAKLLGYEINDDYFKQTIAHDRVLHANGKIYSWKQILQQP